jgi:predicted FMN-binding regulatory protein PaiB
MMDRYQPEGGFRPIAADAAMYRKALAEVGVFRIEPESWTGKVKLLQDKPDEVRQDVMTLLQGRGQPLDLLTVELMERYR